MTLSGDPRPFAFVLAVPDLARNVAYFRDALGFSAEWGERSDWQLMRRGSVRIMMGHCADALRPAETGDHSYFAYLHVDEADALHDEWVNRGALIGHAPIDCEWGMREFSVRTPDGHCFMVGQVLSTE